MNLMNRKAPLNLKVGVDGTWMQGDIRGMGKYANQLTNPILANLRLFTPADCHFKILSRLGQSIYPLWEQCILPHLSNVNEIDVLLCPYNTGPTRSLGGTKLILVIHDLIYMQDTESLPISTSWYHNLGRFYRRKIVPKTARRASQIITVSNYSKLQIIDQLGVDAGRIHIIPNSISEDWFAEPLKLNMRENYFFTVSGDQPSKNLINLLKGFKSSKLWQTHKLKLKVAGVKQKSIPKFQALCRNLGIFESVCFFGYLKEEDLRLIYRQSRGFICASTHEGFGIPIIEAMASGVPVASSNTTALPEICGGCAILFDPRSVNEIKCAITDLYFDMNKNSENLSNGLAHARLFEDKEIDISIQSFWNNFQILSQK